MKGIMMHGIEVSTGKMIFRRRELNAPRIGDEIRLAENIFYKVTAFVWVYDEQEPEYSSGRANLGLEKI